SKDSQSPASKGSELPKELDAGIAAGRLDAAIKKAERARKDQERITSLPNGLAIETLIDRGAMEGIADAFRVRGLIENERDNYAAAATNFREASRRGSARATYELARIKLLRPDSDEASESPVALLESAARNGDVQAAVELALALERGAWIL